MIGDDRGKGFPDDSAGRAILASRRRKGRKKLSVSDERKVKNQGAPRTVLERRRKQREALRQKRKRAGKI